MKVYSDYIPADIAYLTPGKRYEFTPDGGGFGTITDDEGDEIYIATETSQFMCSYLNERQAWKVDEAA